MLAENEQMNKNLVKNAYYFCGKQQAAEKKESFE